MPIASRPRWATGIIERFGGEIEFLKTFNPSNQSFFMENSHDRCFSGHAPSLTRVRRTYGQETALNWIIAQLIDLSLFSGIKEKPEIESLENISRNILLVFGFLKVTELMVFFQLFKAGKFKSNVFYGSIDGMVITAAINEFLNYRRDVLTRIERKIE